jgi:hypothetical protein
MLVGRVSSSNNMQSLTFYMLQVLTFCT